MRTHGRSYLSILMICTLLFCDVRPMMAFAGRTAYGVDVGDAASVSDAEVDPDTGDMGGVGVGTESNVTATATNAIAVLASIPDNEYSVRIEGDTLIIDYSFAELIYADAEHYASGGYWDSIDWYSIDVSVETYFNGNTSYNRDDRNYRSFYKSTLWGYRTLECINANDVTYCVPYGNNGATKRTLAYKNIELEGSWKESAYSKDQNLISGTATLKIQQPSKYLTGVVFSVSATAWWDYWDIDGDEDKSSSGNELVPLAHFFINTSSYASQAHTHTGSITTVQPTCTKAGSITGTCDYADCGQVSETIPALGHSVEGATTIQNGGYLDKYCVRDCGTRLEHTPISYQIQYVPNGGYGTMPNSKHTYDVVSRLSKNLYTREHYDFIGWYDYASSRYSDQQEVVNLTEIDNKTVRLQAIWEPKTYTVTFDGMGGTDHTITNQYGSILGTLPVSQRTGYLFLGWYTEKYGKGYGISSDTLNLGEDTYYANWKANDYEVTFQSEIEVYDRDENTGGWGIHKKTETKKQTYTYDSAFGTLPEMDEVYGYDFVGWTDGDGDLISEEDIFAPETDPEGQVYTAVWEKQTSTLNFYNLKDTGRYDPNGTFEPSHTITAEYLDTVKLPDPEEVLWWHPDTKEDDHDEGDIITGRWKRFYESDRVASYLDDFVIVGAEPYDRDNETSVMHFYPEFVPDDYTVRLRVSADVVEDNKLIPYEKEIETTLSYGESLYELLNSSYGTRDTPFGYKFDHVYYYEPINDTEQGFSQFPNDRTKVETRYFDPHRKSSEMEGMVLTAALKPMTEYYQFVDGDHRIDSGSVDYTDKLSYIPTTEKPGHRFIGWFDADGVQATTDTYMTAGHETTPWTFYAEWEPLQYELSFDANHEDVLKNPDSIIATYTNAIGELPVPETAGYRFLGWFTEAVGGEQIFAETMCPLGDTVYYAHWRPITYTIHFMTDEAEADPGSLEILYKTMIGTLPNPSLSGYRFLGWFDEPYEENMTEKRYAGEDRPDQERMAADGDLYVTPSDTYLYAYFELLFEKTAGNLNRRPGEDGIYGTDDDLIFWDADDGISGSRDDKEVRTDPDGDLYIVQDDEIRRNPGADGIFGTEDDVIFKKEEPELPTETPEAPSGDPSVPSDRDDTEKDTDDAAEKATETGIFAGGGDTLQYVKQDGTCAASEWINDGENWYYFDETGYMKYDWFCDQGVWYMLNKEHDGTFGAALAGWYFESSDGKWYYLDPDGFDMLSGWQCIDGVYYYFSHAEGQTYVGNNEDGWVYDGSGRPYGSMYRNEMTPDGYWVDENGVRR